MTFDSPEVEKLRAAYRKHGQAMSMTATLAEGTHIDLVKLLLELAARDDSNLHFMDPPKHHTGTPVERVAVHAEDNPTGREALGGP